MQNTNGEEQFKIFPLKTNLFIFSFQFIVATLYSLTSVYSGCLSARIIVYYEIYNCQLNMKMTVAFDCRAETLI